MDLFEKWGLSKDASDIDVKKAFRRRVQKMHPDRIGNTAQAQEDFCVLQDEYEILKDTKSREQYIASFKDIPPEQTQDIILADTEINPFEGMFVPSSDVSIKIPVSLSVIWSGGEMEFVAPVAHPCACLRHPLCLICHGTGQYFTQEKIQMDIPAGLSNNAPLVAPMKGHEGTHSVGDVVVHVHWVSSHSWHQDGCDLYCEMLLAKSSFRNGQKIYVALPSGRIHELILFGVQSPSRMVWQFPQEGFPRAHDRGTSFVAFNPAPWWKVFSSKRSQWTLKIKYLCSVFINKFNK